MTPSTTIPNSAPDLPELHDLKALLKGGYLDGWAPTATSLLEWARYRESAEPAETLAADVRHGLTYMPGREGRDLRELIPMAATRRTTQTSRWQPVRGRESGTALKWHGQYLLMRLLEALRERRGSGDTLIHPPGCQILAVGAALKLSGARLQTRTMTLSYRLRSTRNDFRIFTFQRAMATKAKIIGGKGGAGVKLIGHAPVQADASEGPRVYGVYMGRSVPLGDEVAFAVCFKYPSTITEDPWVSYAARYEVGRVDISVDAPRSLATSYDRVEYDGVAHLAPELRRESLARSDDQPMTFPVPNFVPFHRYRLEWHRP